MYGFQVLGSKLARFEGGGLRPYGLACPPPPDNFFRGD